MKTEHHHKKRNDEQNTVVNVIADYIEQLARLIHLKKRLHRVQDSDRARQNADVEHIVAQHLAPREKNKREEQDIDRADVDKPNVTVEARLVGRVGREKRLQEMKQKREGENGE